MKRVFLFSLLTVILIGLSGCRTSRTALTEKESRTSTEAVTDSSSKQKMLTLEQITAALSGSVENNITIEFEEWEYYPKFETGLNAGDTAQNKQGKNPVGFESDPPPDVKSHKVGKITITGKGKIDLITDETNTTTMEKEDTLRKETKLDATIKEKERTETEKETGKRSVWIVVGLILAFSFICVGVYISRKFSK